MKTPARLVILFILACLTFSLIPLRETLRPYTQAPSVFTKRLYDWQERFNHSVHDIDWVEAERLGSQEAVLGESPGTGYDYGARSKDSAGGNERVQDRIEAQDHIEALMELKEMSMLQAPVMEGGQEVQEAEEVKEVKTPLPDKVVVMGKLHTDDTDWVANELPDWQHAIYIVDTLNLTTPLPPDALTTPLNKGREALPYLTYIIDNYAHLPSTLAFIHPHRDGYPAAWHTDAPRHSNVHSLTALRLDYIQSAGYANLRCNTDPGCPAEVRPFAAEPTKEPEAHMAQAWRELFPEGTGTGVDMGGEVPEVIGAACCAQFAVSAEQVRRRPLAEYRRYRDWILETEMSDYVSGRVFEYLWHVIFGREAVHCPAQRDCYCNVYGRRCRGAGRPGRGPSRVVG